MAVGKVEKVEFADGLQVVLVHARIDKVIAPYLDDDAQFWVVEPNVSLRGISGLDTVLSGVYIEGNWDTQADVAQTVFTGLEEPNLTRASERGTSITLRARDGTYVSSGAPILHKGIQVGYVENPQLSFDGSEVTVTAFVQAPYDRRLTTATRFWDTSGFNVSIGASGVELDVTSIAALIEGGIAFDTVVSGGEPIQDGEIFEIYYDEQTARDSLFRDPNEELVRISALFEQSVAGLSSGADIRFQGIRIGRVEELNAIVVGEDDDAEVRLQAVLAIEPSRLGLTGETSADAALAFLSDFVARGLRARLVTGNLLSGSLEVELVQLDDALPAILTRSSGQFPVIPTTAAEISDVAAAAEDVLARINALPIEEVLQGAIDLMASIERLTNDEDLRATPATVRAVTESLAALVASEDIQAIPAEIRAVVGRLDNLLGSADEALAGVAPLMDNADTLVKSGQTLITNVDRLITDLNETQIVADLDSLLAATQSAITQIETVADSVIELAEGLDAFPSELETALSGVGGLVDSANTVAISATDLIANIDGVVGNIDALLLDAKNADVIGGADMLITTAQTTIENIATATQSLPAIMANVEAVTAKANSLELQALATEAQGTLGAIRAILEDEQTAALAGNINAALQSLESILVSVQDGGAVENVNQMLASASDAALAIEEAVADLPQLSARASRLVAQIEEVAQGYGERSRFGAETLATLRDIQSAADAVTALARTIQRNPNVLITGR